MDKKYLAEIKAREQAATPGPWSKDGSIFMANSAADSDFIAHARTDIPALLAEVERQNQQIATLKKALELMSETACGEVPGIMPEWDMIGCVPDKRCMKENPCKDSDNQCHECWTRYFIQQAQAQQTHETQEGKK